MNTTEIYLLPSLNPDGYAISRTGDCDNNRAGRNNANDVDLNRNFPKQFDEPQVDFLQSPVYSSPKNTICLSTTSADCSRGGNPRLWPP